MPIPLYLEAPDYPCPPPVQKGTTLGAYSDPEAGVAFRLVAVDESGRFRVDSWRLAPTDEEDDGWY